MTRSTLAVVTTFAALSLIGCESTSKGNLNQALADYDAQHYAQAHKAAAGLSDRGQGAQREDAAYLAGLSAYQMGDLEEAQDHLQVAAGSTTPQTSGSAKAMLGQVRLDQNRPREAATLFAEASKQLTGDDARRAAHYAGLAYRQAGDADASERWLAPSGPRPGTATSLSLGVASSALMSSGGGNAGFTLQAGAFADKRRAQRAADEAQELAKRDSLGAVRVIPRKDDRGRRMYLVQFGWFPTRSAAAEARAKIGRLNYIVASATSSSSM